MWLQKNIGMKIIVLNKASKSELRKLSSFLPKHAKKQPIHSGSFWRRYERGSKINKTSHVLDLRHVVAGLSALKYVGSLYLTSFVPGAN